MKACLCCPFICNNNNKNNKKKSNLASPVPAGLLPLCSESVFILLSSFNIPTLKSWSVLSDPFIQAGGSWTLRKFNRLFSSGKDSVKESESLLVMLQRSHSSMPQYHTGQNHFWWKLRMFRLKMRVYEVNISWKYPEPRTRKKRVLQSEAQSSVGLRQKQRQRIEQRIALAWLTFIPQTSPKSTSQ